MKTAADEPEGKVMDRPQHDRNLQNWAGYEYIGPGDRFHPVHYEKQGGVNDAPYIWADDSMWSLDTPENPTSILALLTYRNWTGQPLLDIRNAAISFYLRGDSLDRKGGECFFWITTGVPTTVRWHYIARPIAVSVDSWGRRVDLRLTDNPDHWHRSFSGNPGVADNLTHSLRSVTSYGFSFVGFSEKVVGRLSLCDFTLQKRPDALWSWSADFESRGKDWQTVSRRHNRQVITSNGYVEEGLNNGCMRRRSMTCIEDDILLIPSKAPFAYLSFVHESASTCRQDLSDTILCAAVFTEALDLKGGSVHFFVEHTGSNTRWIYADPIQAFVTEIILDHREEKWRRITGTAPLEEVLRGRNGNAGYDYLGFMVVGAQAQPTGNWGLYYLSLGPCVQI